jgi:hypothetical protein
MSEFPVRFIRTDGGRSAAGYVGEAGDCVARAVAVASGRSYQEVYDALSVGCRGQRLTRGRQRSASARNGVDTSRKWFKDYMRSLGFRWVPTMQVGQGCKVHLRAEELPSGRLVVAVSKHYVAVLNGIIHDTFDPSRNGTRCVYGYWVLT